MNHKLKSKLLYYRDDFKYPLFSKKYRLPEKFPKILLVKQDVYADLYCCPNGSDWRTIVFSSLLRSGFVGLFTKCKADFVIVKTDDAPECQVWKEFSKDPKDLEKLLALRNSLPSTNILPQIKPQGDYALSVDEINWGDYDIVISINISVPQRITKKFPQTVWAYCIGEPYMATYQSSYKSVVPGYDLFLNQKFRRRATRNRFHEIDFPYYLQYYGCLNDLLALPENIGNKSGTIIEKHTLKELSKSALKKIEQLGPVYFQEGNTEEMLTTILKAKYYFRMGGPRRWGNAMVEAGAGGCIFLGNKNEFVNQSLFSGFTHIQNTNEFFRKVEILESGNSIYKRELDFLTGSVTNLCFNRPIVQLLEKQKAIIAARNK